MGTQGGETEGVDGREGVGGGVVGVPVGDTEGAWGWGERRGEARGWVGTCIMGAEGGGRGLGIGRGTIAGGIWAETTDLSVLSCVIICLAWFIDPCFNLFPRFFVAHLIAIENALFSSSSVRLPVSSCLVSLMRSWKCSLIASITVLPQCLAIPSSIRAVLAFG